MNKSKSGWTLYLMVHLPFVWWWKIGITGQTAAKRAKAIDRAVFGFPVPVFFVILPGAYFVEQWLHREFSASNIVFYRGDGRTEWFWFWVAPFAFAVMVAIWGVYWWAAGALLGFDGVDWYMDFLRGIFETLKEAAGWLLSILKRF